jgi:hypothetical protein|tara:strand:+ start:303 stop:578 length:276 start_codon:yes stop_codon:yes gene_type:complete
MKDKKTMKNFLIKIRAHGYITEFNVRSLDEAESLEKAIVDKLGKNDITWEKSNFYSLTKKWLTFEEVKDGTLTRPVQTKTVLGVELGTGTS